MLTRLLHFIDYRWLNTRDENNLNLIIKLIFIFILEQILFYFHSLYLGSGNTNKIIMNVLTLLTCSIKGVTKIPELVTR